MDKDKVIVEEFNMAYNEALVHWSQFLGEAKKDLDFYVGNQWDTNESKYLKEQRRNVLVFNYIHKLVKMVSGHQRKNRLALKVDPVEFSDEATANQFSGLLQWVMQSSNGYNILSDAFENGALKTGMNLVHIYMDYTRDAVSGDIRFKRIPYNKFMLDPNFSERDLSDCSYILRREYLQKNAVKSLLPGKNKNIDELDSIGYDNKYTDFIPPRGIDGKPLMVWDEMYVKTFEKNNVLIDKQTGQHKTFKSKDKALLKEILNTNPNMKVIDQYVPAMELRILVNNKVMYKGPDPTGLDEFPFVPILGFFDPEIDDSKWKLRSLVRGSRDPQAELNRRRSKIQDIIDSVINTGWQAGEDSVVNPKSLFQSGQGQVIWTKKGTPQEDLPKQLTGGNVPEGVFRYSEMLEGDLTKIPGANDELFGQSQEQDIAGVLAKMRVGAGLTIFQDIFDNYRLSKKCLGTKVVKVIQNAFSPEKVSRILNQEPSKEFFDRTFGHYDVIATEGILSDSQKQMASAQLISLKQIGMPIPDSHIIDSVNIENKAELKKAMAEAAKQQAASSKESEELDNLVKGLTAAQIASSKASVDSKTASAEEDRMDVNYKLAKTLKELQSLDLNKMKATVELMKSIGDLKQNMTGVTRR